MKRFNEKNLVENHLYVNEEELEYRPLSLHSRLQQTATGYGRKLTSHYMISFCGRMYRIYSTCYSNAASSYINTKAYGKIFIG